MIITDSRHPVDAPELASWARREEIVAAPTWDATIGAVCRGTPRLGLTDGDAWPPGAGGQVARMYRAAIANVPLLFRTELTPRALAEVTVLACGAPEARVRVSFRRHETLEECLAGAWFPTATLAILRETAPLVTPRTQPLIGILTVMCDRLESALVVAVTAGMGKDKFRDESRACGLPEFIHARSRILGAHVLTALEAGVPEDVCAARARFDGAGDMRKYFKRHCGRGPEDLLAEGGAPALVAEIAGWLAVGGRGGWS